MWATINIYLSPTVRHRVRHFTCTLSRGPIGKEGLFNPFHRCAPWLSNLFKVTELERKRVSVGNQAASLGFSSAPFLQTLKP